MSTITKLVKAKVPKKKLKFVSIAIMVIVPCSYSYFYWNAMRGPVHRKLRTTPCFLRKRDDLLPKSESRVNPLALNIFFIEKECEQFTPRFACAIEAAAQANPEMQINVLFIGPAYNIRKLVAIQTQFPNVKFVRIYLQDFANDSKLRAILNEKSLRKRRILQTGTLDILKYWVLIKYGGIYLDKNMIAIGPLAKYTTNWVVKRNRYSFASEPMGLVNDAVGNRFFNMMTNEIVKFFLGPLQWAKKPMPTGRVDVSYLLEKVLKRFCRTSYVPIMTTKRCRDLNIHHQEELYPPAWDNWFYYLQPGELVHHKAHFFPLLKNIPKDKEILNTSRYAKLIRRHCPMTVHMQRGNDFKWLNDFDKEDVMKDTNITREIITMTEVPDQDGTSNPLIYWYIMSFSLIIPEFVNFS